jgi:hypothetical protein
MEEQKELAQKTFIIACIINYSKEDLIVEETDKMTNETSFRSKDVIYIPGRYEEQRITFYAATEQNEEYLFLAFYVYGAGDCISEDSKIIFLFKDKEIITLVNKFRKTFYLIEYDIAFLMSSNYEKRVLSFDSLKV